VEGEGYPSQANEEFRKACVNDLVFSVIIPVLAAFRRKTNRNLRLRREKEVLSKDAQTGGYEEFLMVDVLSLDDTKYVSLVEAKKSSLGEAKRRCLLAMKDMGDSNGGGVVCGFVTTGEEWQLFRLEDGVFTQTDGFFVLFRGIAKEEDRWIRDASIVVDCVHAALRSAGTASV